jgi:hypothetical protein
VACGDGVALNGSGLTWPANHPVDFARPVQRRLLIRLTLEDGKGCQSSLSGADDRARGKIVVATV